MEKPIEDRVKESVTLLKKLMEVGISEYDVGYKEVKSHLDKWIKTGEQWAGKVTFPRHGRKGDLVLPNKKDRVSSLKLLAPSQ